MTKQGGWASTGFARKLRAAREAAGLTQAQLAEKAGCHPMTLAKLEAGRNEPAWPLVRALARALGVTCQAFETDTTDPVPADEPRPRGRPKKDQSGEGKG